MKNLYVVSMILIFALLSCSNKNDTFNVTNIIEVNRSINEKQVYNISTKMDTTITLKGGVKVQIPNNAFVDNDNQILDSVSVSFTECLTIESMLTEKLSTISDSTLLITNGMLKIEVSNSKVKGQLAEGKQLNVSFPRNGLKEKYNYFYGEKSNSDSIINWKLSPENEISDSKKIITKKFIKEIRYAGFTIKTANFTPTYQFEDLSLKRNLFEYFEDNFKPSNSAMNWFFTNHSLKESSDVDGLHITIHYNKDITIKKIELSSTHIQFSKEVEEFIKNLPKINYATVRDYNLSTPSIYFTMYAIEELDQDDFAKQAEKKGLDNVIEEDLEYYVYSISNLGWMNCDIFFESENKIDMYFSKQNPLDLNYSLVFNSMKSIMKPSIINDRIVFNNVPEGESVKLVGYEIVGDSVLYTSSEDFMIKKEIVQDFNIEHISFVEFKSRLEGLNR